MTGRRLALLSIAAVVVVGAVAVFVLLSTSRNSGSSANSTSATPPDAIAAVTALATGDRQQIADALSPPLAGALPPDAHGMSARADVAVAEWQQDGVFAVATATVHGTGSDVRLEVGFRQVNGRWRITFAHQADPQ